MKQRDGFPEPLVDFDDEISVRKFAETMMNMDGAVKYLLFYAPVGPLRASDPILGDLTVAFREAWKPLLERLNQLHVWDPSRITMSPTQRPDWTNPADPFEGL